MERMVDTNGVELCAESFGDPADPPILLVMGIGGSMVWWDEGFCRMLADGGRFVIRYDHRDTGRSTAYEPGSPGYTGSDLVGDAAAVIEGHGIAAAHVVGVSMGGAIAQLLALDFPGRVASLTLVSTSPAGSGLPPMAKEYEEFLAGAEKDWTDPVAAVDYVVGECRVLNGDGRPFDEEATRELVSGDLQRARNFASAQNHGLISDAGPWRERLPSIGVPTLVIHGTADPLFGVEHGAALAKEIPEARMLTMAGAGHLLHPADWETVAGAILDHTEPRGNVA